MKASTLIRYLADLIHTEGDKEVPVKIRTRNQFEHTIQYDVHEIVFVAMTEAGIIVEKQPIETIHL
jgi:hypothetical protein